MICFKDTTFCMSPNCTGKCGRQWTPELERQAKEADMLVAFSYFCGEPAADAEGE